MADEHLPASFCPSGKPEVVLPDRGGWISGPCLPDDGPPGSVTAAALMFRFPGWKVTYDPGHSTWTAERRDGTEVRVLVAYRPSELAAKIEAAEEEGTH